MPQANAITNAIGVCGGERGWWRDSCWGYALRTFYVQSVLQLGVVGVTFGGPGSTYDTPHWEFLLLIELHAHHMTPAMFDLDPHWGPSWVGQQLKVGNWMMRHKKFPDLQQVGQDQSGAVIFDRMDHDFRHQMMTQLGIDVVVISNSPLLYYYWAGDFGVEYATVVNDEFAKWCAVDPQVFFWWAQVPMHRPAAAAIELERAVGMGAVGLMCGGADFGGLDLHSREMDELWAKVVELDVPVFIHGHPQATAWQDPNKPDPLDTTTALGYMYDESRAFWHLTCGGVLDRFPALKVYITHAGGFTPYQIERFGALDGTLAPDSVNKRPIAEYMPNFYFDLMVPHDGMRRALTELIGVDNLVYGSNLGGSDQIAFDLTDRIGLTDHDRERIKSGNALKLLHLDGKVPTTVGHNA